jgi:hypothetical protein
VLTSAWRRLVFPPPPMPVGSVEKRAFIVASTEALRTGLHRHEVYVPGLRKWGDPNARLLEDDPCEAVHSRVCEELDLEPKPDKILKGWTDRSMRLTVASPTAWPPTRPYGSSSRADATASSSPASTARTSPPP